MASMFPASFHCLASGNESFAFLTSKEWGALAHSPGLATTSSEAYEKPCFNATGQRHYIEIQDLTDATKDKIQELMKNFVLPKDVTLEIESVNEKERSALLKFKSQTHSRNFTILSHACEYSESRAERITGYSIMNPLYGVVDDQTTVEAAEKTKLA